MQQLVTFINAKRKRSQCPRCDTNNWVVDGISQLNLQNQVGGMVFGGPVAPMGLLTCRNCAYVELVSLVVAGVVPGGGV